MFERFFIGLYEWQEPSRGAIRFFDVDGSPPKARRPSNEETLSFEEPLAEIEKTYRFERAAVRWHGRFEVEVPGLSLADAQLLLAAVAGLRQPAPRVSLESIALLAERVRQSSVAATAKRRA